MKFQDSSQIDFTTFKNAAPYMQKFKESIFVVKLGGELCESSTNLDLIAEQLEIIKLVGIKLIVIHGGGHHATELAKKLQVENEFISGRRVTSSQMLDVVKMSFAGLLNTDIVSNFLKNSLNPIGLSGIDGGLVTAKKRPPKKVIDNQTAKEITVDYGFVADIDNVNTSVINHLLEGGFTPVICSLASDRNGQVLNINGDTLASNIATSVNAKKLLILGTVNGVLQDINNPNSLLSILTKNDVETLLKSSSISGGMIPKLTNALDALNKGVQQIHIISGKEKDAILQEVFTEEGCGTMIIP